MADREVKLKVLFDAVAAKQGIARLAQEAKDEGEKTAEGVASGSGRGGGGSRGSAGGGQSSGGDSTAATLLRSFGALITTQALSALPQAVGQALNPLASTLEKQLSLSKAGLELAGTAAGFVTGTGVQAASGGVLVAAPAVGAQVGQQVGRAAGEALDASFTKEKFIDQQVGSFLTNEAVARRTRGLDVSQADLEKMVPEIRQMAEALYNAMKLANDVRNQGSPGMIDSILQSADSRANGLSIDKGLISSEAAIQNLSDMKRGRDG